MAYGKDAAKKKREPIEEIELEGMAREFIRSSLGGPDSEIAAIRERNVRAYNAQPEGEFAPPEIDDRSAYVASDVADTVDGMLPQLIDVFVSDDKAVECVAKKPGEQAEASARQATGYLNHLFYVRNEGLNVLHDWIQDAALQKVGFVKVWAEEDAEDSKQTYEGQSQDQLAAILMDGAQLQDEPTVDDEGGLTFTVIDESKRVKFHVACVAPHRMRIGPSAKWGDDPLQIGEVEDKPRFELEEMGFDLSDVGAGGLVDNSEAEAMVGDGENETEVELHDSYKLYEYAELYFKIDADGDGTAEWIQLCLVNGTLLRVEQVDDHPYADICLMPRAHAYFGDCPADRAFTIQKEQTNLARALFDNIQFATNQRTYINTNASVNIGDLLDNRPGGIVRGTGDAGSAFAPIPTIPLNQSAWQMQEWLSVRLENRTGFTRYSQGMDADSLNKTATGVSIITSKADMRLRLMTRFAAQGIRKMFGKLLKLATKHQDRKDWFNVNGEWQEVNPYEWRDQFNISINVGLGHGTKEQQAQRVMAMLPLQMQGLQLGIVQPKHIANTIRTFARVNEFQNPDDFCDAEAQGPSPEQVQQMQQQMQEMQQALQQAGEENQQLKLANQNKAGELQLRSRELDLKEQEAAADFMLKQQAAADDAAIRQAEMQGGEVPEEALAIAQENEALRQENAEAQALHKQVQADIKLANAELDKKAAEMELQHAQWELQQAQQATEQASAPQQAAQQAQPQQDNSATTAALVAGFGELIRAANAPKSKTGKMVRKPDGSYEVSTQETPE